MSEPAWEEMLEIRQVEFNSRTLVNASKDSSKFSNESLKLLSDELLQVSGHGSFNQSSEDVAVEHLLVELEPKYSNSVLDFDAFNLKKCYSIEELSALEYVHVEANVDRLNSSLIQGEKTAHKLFDGKSEGINDDLCDGINNLPDIYEDYLLDPEFEECVSDFYSVPSKEYCMGNLSLDQHSNSGPSQCGSKVVELSTSSRLVSKAKCDANSSLLDKMTTDELHMAFKKVFCRETIVMDREWLKNRILFGLQNLDVLDNCLNLLECHVTSYDNKGEMAVSKQNEPLRASSPFTEVFSFKTKPRSRHMRRQRHGKHDYLKTFSVEVSKSVSSLPDLGERESVIVTKGRMCRPAQRYMDGSAAKKLRSRRRNFDDSVAFSKDKVPHIRSKRQYYREGFRAKASVHEVGKSTIEGACTQPPFGLQLDKENLKEKGHEFEACTDIGSLRSYVDSDMELFSAESQYFSSQDESLTITKTRKSKGGRRKQHILWSLPEVLKLVDGVSEFGVGRWTDIKRVLFSSSPHRSSVDLKDKWRNLLRASCKRSHSVSEAESRKKHRTLYIPPKILHRVRELAVMFPYPREHKAKASKNVGITLKFSIQKCDNLLPLSMTV